MPTPLTPIIQLPPGSNQYTLTGLTPTATYTAVVVHVEPAPSTGTTTPVSVTFTTAAGTSTCAAPDDPIPFVVLHPSPSSLVAGIAAFNNEVVPGTAIVFNVATETSIGSGTYGSFSEAARIVAMPLAWAVHTDSFPVDGLRRLFQAFASRPGVTDSAPTASVAVNPAVALQPADYPIPIPADLAITPVIVVMPSGTTAALIATYTPPTDHDFDHMEYIVQQRLTNGTYAVPGQIVVGGKIGSDVLIAAAGGVLAAPIPPALPGSSAYQVTPITITTGAPDGTIIPGMPIAATRVAGPTFAYIIPPLGNIPTFVAGTVSGNQVSYTVTFDQGTAYVRVFSAIYASDPGTVDTVETAPGATTNNYLNPDLIPPSAGGRTVTFQLPVTSGNPYRVTTFVPFSNAGIRGAIVTIKSHWVTGGAPTAPTLVNATWTGPGGGAWAYPNNVGVKVTFAGSPAAGDFINLMRGGTALLSYTITAADVTAGFAIVIDTTAASGGVYSYTATQQAASGGISAVSSAVVITVLTAGTISAPVVTFSGSGHGGINVSAQPNTDHSTPSGANALVQYSYASSSGPWTTLGTLPIGDAFHIAPFSGAPSKTVFVQAQAQAAGYSSSAFGAGSHTVFVI